MAEIKVLDYAGLEYFAEKIDAKYVKKEAGKGLSSNDFTDSYKNTIDGLVTTFGQANVIETVKGNGTALTPDASKAVNIDLSGYVVKETGKRLMTDAEGTKLSKLADDPNATYATKDQVSAIPKFAVVVVDALPTEDISTSTLYLVPNRGSGNNSHDEYIYAGGAWELLGTTQVDISGKADKTYVDTELGKKADKSTTYTKTEVNTELDKKADATHNHAIADVTGLQTALDAKLNSADLVTVSNDEIDAMFTA